jgi:hypothetical protein
MKTFLWILNALIAIFIMVWFCGCNDYNHKSQPKKAHPASVFDTPPQKNKIYVILVIHISSPSYSESSGGGDEYKNWKESVVVSEIQELSDMNEEIEYRMLDKFEAYNRDNNFDFRVPNWPVKILKRECLQYGSYVAASKARSTLTD